MSTNIRFKRSDIPGKVPSLESIDLGELALNTADGKLFMKQEIKAPPGVAAIQKIIEIGATEVPNVLYVAKNGDDSNSGRTLGQAFLTLKKALSIATPGTTIFLKSGEYIEDNPLRVPARVSVVGDNLRNTTVRPKNPTKDIFWVYNGAYIFCMNFKGHIAPSAAVCFPPDGSAGEIVTSPYTQAVTSITTTGTGMRVDGAVTTGLRSMVCDAFTQYNQGGIGIHMLNRGNTQLVSIFTICCDISFMCENGGFCSVNLSNSSFGNYGLVSRGASEPLYRGVVKKSAGRQITFKNLARRPNIGDGVLFADYNQRTCDRDNGLVVDSLAFDLLYEGTTQSTFSGLRYWKKDDITTGIEQQEQTAAAIKRAQTVARAVVKDVAFTSPSNSVQQVLSSALGISVGSDTAKRIITEEFDIISKIVTDGPNSPALVIGPDLDAAEPEYKNLREQVLDRKAQIVDETITFLKTNYPTLAYVTSKCKRDVDLIIEAVIDDMIFGTNYKTIKATLSYLKATVNEYNVPENQRVATIEAYKFARDRIVPLVQEDATLLARVQANFEIVTKGLEQNAAAPNARGQTFIKNLLDPSNADYGLVFPAQQDTDADVVNLVTNLQENKNYVIEEVIDYINKNWPEVVAYQYSQDTCRRDLGYAIDAICYDIIYGGNSQTLDAAKRYFNYASGLSELRSSEEVPATIDAFGRAQLLSQRVVILDEIEGTSGATQVLNDLTATTQTQVNKLGGLFSVFLKQLETSTVGTSDFIQPNGMRLADSGLDNAYALLQANKAFIRNDVVNYLSRAYPGFDYDRVKCARDVDYIIDSVCFDLVHGGNRQAVTAGIYYYDFNEETNVLKSVVPNQIKQTVNAYKYMKELLRDVLTCSPVPNPWQGNVPQITDLPAATGSEVVAVGNLIDIINEILQEGPNNTEDSIQRIKQPIGLTASADANKLRAFNLLMANRQFIRAEMIAYINQNWFTISDGDTQFARVNTATDLTLGTTTTGYPTVTYQPSLYKSIRDAVLAAKEDIKTETIKFMANSFFDNFSFNKPKCYRDVGLILDAILSDMIFGSNYKTVTAAISYLRAYASEVVGNQKVQTVASLKAAKDITLRRIVNPNAKSEISTRFDIVINILDGARVNDLGEITTNATVDGQSYTQLSGYAPALTYPIPVRNNEEDIDRYTAVNILRDNMDFIKEEIVSYIDANFTLNEFDREKCARDVGFIVDALGYDLMFISNFRSISAGRSYLRANSAKVAGSQKLATLGSFRYLKKLVTEIVKSNNLAVNSVQRGMDIIIDILDKGEDATPKYIIPFPATGRNVEYKRARDLVQKNREFIIDDVLTYINTPGLELVPASVEFKFLSSTGSGATLVKSFFTDGTFVAVYPEEPTSRLILDVGDLVRVSGKLFGTSTIDGYSSPAVYKVASKVDTSVAGQNATTEFKLVNLDGSPLVVSGGTSGKTTTMRFEKINSSAYADPAGFDIRKCRRDLELILDALYYDTTYGGTLESEVAGKSYVAGALSQLDPLGSQGDEVYATLRAYNYLKSIVSTVAQDIVWTPTVGNTTTQVRSPNGSDGSATAAKEMETCVNLITKLIDDSVTESPAFTDLTTISSAPSTDWCDPALVKAYKALQAGKEVTKEQVTDFVDENYVLFGYDRAKCARDVGYVIEAVRFDMLFNSNFRSIVAGRSYYRAMASTVVKDQKTATLASFQHLKDKLLEIVKPVNPDNPTTAESISVQRVTRSMDIILNILENGLAVEPTILLTEPTGGTDNAFDDADIAQLRDDIQDNRTAIEDDLITWIDGQITTGQPFAGVTYNETACRRDVEYILDALIYDLTYGGDMETTVAARAYYGGTTDVNLALGSDEQGLTIAAYGELKDIIDGITAVSITPSSDLIDVIINYINTGNEVAATQADYSWVDNGIRVFNDKLALTATVNKLKNAVTDFVDLNFAYNRDKCYRDVGFLIDAMCYDLLYGGNVDTTQAAIAYFDGAVTPKSTIPKQIIQTVAAYERLKDVLDQVVQLKDVVPSGNQFEAKARATANMDLIIKLVKDGPAFTPAKPFLMPAPTSGANSAADADWLNATKMIAANRAFLIAEVTSFIKTEYPTLSYNQVKCERDVDLIIDAVLYDLTYGGKTATTLTAEAYYEGTVNTGAGPTSLDGELTESLAAYAYLGRLMKSIASASKVTSTFTVTSGTASNNRFTTTADHGLAVDDRVTFYGATADMTSYGLTGYSVITAINAGNDTITVTNSSIFQVGSQVKVSATTGNITTSDTLYVKAISGNAITLTAASSGFALAATFDITGTLSGSPSLITTTVVQGTSYFVESVPTATTFTVSTIKGGDAFDISTDQTVDIYVTRNVYQGDKVQRIGTGDASIAGNAAERARVLVQEVLNPIIDGQAGTTAAVIAAPSTTWVDEKLVALSDAINNSTFRDDVKAEVNTLLTTKFAINYAGTQKTQCEQDIDAVIDAVRFDVMFGSNYRSQLAGNAYYRGFSGLANVLGAQKDGSVATFELVKDAILEKVALYTVEQDKGGQAGSTAAGDFAALRIQNIIDLIDSTLGDDPPEDEALVDWVDLDLQTLGTALKNAKDGTAGADNVPLLITNYIDNRYEGTLTYNQADCQADVASIIDAVRYDMMFNSNFRTISAARAYFRAQASKVVGEQKAATIEAFKFLKEKLSAIVNTNATALERVQDRMDLLITIVDKGEKAIPAYVLPSPTGYNTSRAGTVSFGYARNLIETNREFLKAEVLKFIRTDSNIPNALDFNESKCARDLDLILDAVYYDMTYGGNMETMVAGGAYYLGNFASDLSGSQTATLPDQDEIDATLLAFGRLKDMIKLVAEGKDVSDLQIIYPQVEGDAGSTAGAQTAKNLAYVIRNLVNQSGSFKVPAPTLAEPNISWVPANLKQPNDLMVLMKTSDNAEGGYTGRFSIQSQLTEWVRLQLNAARIGTSSVAITGPSSGPLQAYYNENGISAVGDWTTWFNVVSASSMVSGRTYAIASLNDGNGGANSDFTLGSSLDNNIGTEFTWNGTSVGGTGRVVRVVKASEIVPGRRYKIKSLGSPASSWGSYSTTTFTPAVEATFIVKTPDDNETIPPAAVAGEGTAYEMFTYDIAKCERDILLVLDAVRYDMMFGTTFRTATAARSYWRQQANEALGTGSTGLSTYPQTEQSSRLFTFMKDIIRNLPAKYPNKASADKEIGLLPAVNAVNTPLAHTRLGQLMDLIVNTINANDLAAVNNILPKKPFQLPLPTGGTNNSSEDGFRAARDLVELNRSFIKAEVIAWIDQQKRENREGFQNNPDGDFPATDFVFDRAECAEDLDLILDAIYYDLTYGGNMESYVAGLAYYSGIGIESLPTDEREATIRAYNYMGMLIYDVARNIITTSYQTALEQVKGTAGSAETAAKLKSLVDIVINVVKGGVKQVPPRVDPDFLAGDETLAYVRISVQEQKQELQARIADYIDAFILQYNTEKCARDVGLILDAAMYDLVLNSNFQSVTAGSVYLQKAANVVYSTQIGPQLQAIKFIRDQVIAISQTPPLVKNEDAIGRITNLFDTMFDIIDKGVEVAPPIVNVPPVGAAFNPNAVNAANSIIANKEFLKEEVVAYITANYKTYDQSRCSRDVGLIIDAALYDLLLDTNYNSVKAGLAYRRATSSLVLTDQLQETLGGIDFAKQRVVELLDDADAIASVTRSFELISSIIGGGSVPTSRVPLPGGSVYALTRPSGSNYRDAAFQTAATALRTAKATLKTAVSTWIASQISGASAGSTWENFVYGVGTQEGVDRQTKCEEDVGYIIDAVAYDLIYGGNMETLVAGYAYYTGTADASLPSATEIQNTIAAYTYLADQVRATVNAAFTLQPNTDAQSAIEAQNLVLGVRNLIDSRANAVAMTRTPSQVWVDPLLQEINQTFIQDKKRLQDVIIDYVEDIERFTDGAVTYPEGYDKDKCRRDVGLVLDAIRYDLMFGTSFRTIVAGRSYRRSFANVITGAAQGPANVSAFKELRERVLGKKLANVTIVNTSGNFSCPIPVTERVDMLVENQPVRVSGVYAEGAGTIAGFSNIATQPKTYYVIGTPTQVAGVLSFQLSDSVGGTAVATTVGDGGVASTGGLTFEIRSSLESLDEVTTQGLNDTVTADAEDATTPLVVGREYKIVSVGKDTIQAGTFITGGQYKIATVGNTDYISLGATSNTEGLVFTATGAGVGTGTAIYYTDYTDFGARNNNVGTVFVATGTPNTATGGSGQVKTVSFRESAERLFDLFLAILENEGDDTATVASADGSTDVFTTSGAHGFIVGDAVEFTTNASSYGLFENTTYYIKNVGSSTTFTLSTELDGATFGVPGSAVITANMPMSRSTKIEQLGFNHDNVLKIPAKQGGSGTYYLITPPELAEADFDSTALYNAAVAAQTARITARNQINAARATLENNLITWIDAQVTNTNGNFGGSFAYVEATCRKDVKYILDAITYDLTFGGNQETVVAGKAYYDGTALGMDEKLATIDAYNYFKTLLVTTAGANSGDDDAVALLIDELISYIDPKIEDPRVIEADTSWVDSELYVFSDKLKAAANTVAKATTDYVTANFAGLSYDVATCQRDVKLVIDAVRWDMMFNSNFRTIVAARSYYRAQASLVVGAQKEATEKAFGVVKVALDDLVKSDSVAQTRVAALMDIVINLVAAVDQATALATLPAISTPYGGTPNASNIGYLNARDRIARNRDFIVDEMSEWLDDQNYAFAAYDKTVCLRDIELVLDAVAYDLTYGGNMASVEAGKAYYAGAVLPNTAGTDHIDATIDAFEHLRDIIEDVALNNNITATSGVTVAYVQDDASKETADDVQAGIKVVALVDTVISWVDSNNGTAEFRPSTNWVDNNLALIASTMLDRKESLGLQVTDFIDAEYPTLFADSDTAAGEATGYSKDKCKRDVGLVTEAVRWDMMFATNFRSWTAGRAYYRQAENLLADGLASQGQKEASLAGYRFLKGLLATIAGNNVTATTRVKNAMNVVIDTLEYGPTTRNAYDARIVKAVELIDANKDALIADMTTWLRDPAQSLTDGSSFGANYSEEKCLRDLKYLIDAIKYDLTYGGNMETVTAGLAYYDGVVLQGGANNTLPGDADHIAKTQAAFTYLGTQIAALATMPASIADKVAALITDVNQSIRTADENLVIGKSYKIVFVGTTNWNTVAGTTGVTYSVGDIVKVAAVGAGTGYATLVNNEVKADASWSESSLQELSVAMRLQQTAIKAQVTDYVEDKFPGLMTESQKDKCARDAGLLIDAVRWDMLFNSNFRSITAGRAYYRTVLALVADALAGINQKQASVAAFTFLKGILQGIVASNAIAYERVTANMDIILEIIENGLDDQASPAITYGTIANAQRQAAHDNLIDNIPFLKDEIVKYIDATFDNIEYDEVKCSRDVELITRAVAYDMVTNSNYQTITAARGYLRANANQVLTDQQKHITVLAMKYLKNLLTNYVGGNATAIARVKARMDIIIQVIYDENDTSLPALSFPTNTVTTSTTNTLQTNRDAIVSAVTSWLSTTYDDGNGAGVWYGTFDDNATKVAKCERDVGFIVDALTHDLTYGGNWASVINAISYYVGVTNQLGTGSGEVAATLAAYEQLKTIVLPYVTAEVNDESLVIGKTYKIATLGDTAWNTVAGTTGVTYAAGNTITVVAVGAGTGTARLASDVNTANSLINIIKDVIDNDETAAPAIVYPELLGSDNALEAARNVLISNIVNAKAKVIRYVNDRAYFTYNVLKCERDIGLILEAVFNDVATGSNVLSVQAGISYLRAVASPAIAAPQKWAILAGLTQAKNILENVVPTNQAARVAIRANLSVVIDIINDGVTPVVVLSGSSGSRVVDSINSTGSPYVALSYKDDTAATGGTPTAADRIAAKNALRTDATRKSIITAVLNSVDNTAPATGYDPAKCARDLAFILDAVAHDILHGGNLATRVAAQAYWANAVNQLDADGNAANEITETVTALGTLKTAVSLVAPFTGANGTASVFNSRIDEIIAVLDGNGLNDLAAESLPSFSGSDLTGARTALFAAKEASTYSILDSINSRPFLVYDQTKCERDVGIILDALRYDIMLGSNFKSIRAGQAYLRSYAKAVTQEQKAATISSLYFIKKSVSVALDDDADVADASVTSARGLMDLIIDILDRGVAAIPGDVVQTSPPYQSEVVVITPTVNVAAVNTIKNNKAFIKAEVRAFLDRNYSELDYDKIKCERDLDYILDALRYDLAFAAASGQANSETREAGLAYWEGNTNAPTLGLHPENIDDPDFDGVTTGGEDEKTATVEAYTELATIVQQILNNSYTAQQTVVPLGTYVTGAAAAKDTARDLIIIIKNMVNTTSLALAQNVIAAIPPAAAGDTDVNDVISEDVGTNLKATLPEDVTDEITAAFATQFFVYNKTKCARDVGFIVEALAFDALYGGNKESRVAASQYAYKGGLVIPMATKGPTVGGFERLVDIIDDIVAGVDITETAGVTQAQQGIGNTSTLTGVSDLAQITVDVLNGKSLPALVDPTFSDVTGFKPDYLVVRSVVRDSSPRIAAETITYINETYAGFGYLQDTCKRDIGLTCDAMAYDLIYGGNSRTKFAAEQYFSGGRFQIPADSKSATVASFEYLGALIRKVIKNESIITFQNFVDQNKSNIPATNSEVSNVAALTDAFTDILTNGYISVLQLDATFNGSVDDNTFATFHQVSTITTTGHTLEWVGTGIDVDSALPYNGGVPKPENQLVSEKGGFINFTSTDEKGDFRIGPDLTIKRDSGSIVGRAFNKSLLGVVTPYILALQG